MTRRYRTGSTQGQRDGARGIEPKELYPTDARDRQLPRGPQYRRYTQEVPADHVEWARTRYLYPWVPTTPLGAYYQFAAQRSRTFTLANGWAVGTL